jgi:ATP-dependent helicase/nuclease subunit A
MSDPSAPSHPARLWTDAQWRGITTTGRSLLVSAAAGSGKTAVLAERCAHLVCDAADSCDVDELLVVTFTEAAAAEMKSRIGKALRARAAANPSDRLTRQLALLDRASISTLHGFCSRLLRQQFHLVGLDPAFGVLDADDAKLLRGDVARQLFADRYELDEKGEFSRLVDAYAEGDDARLARLVLHAHEMLTSLVDPEAWTDRALRRIREGAEAPKLTDTELGRELYDFVSAGLSSIAERCDAAIAQLGSGVDVRTPDSDTPSPLPSPGGRGRKGRGSSTPGGEPVTIPPLPPGEGGGEGVHKRKGASAANNPFARYIDLLKDHRSTLYLWERQLKENGIDALAAEVATFVPGKLPPVKNDVPGKDAAKAAVDAVRDAMKAGDWRDCLRFTTAEWRDGLNAILPHAEVFLGLVKQFGERYRMAKEAARAVDFSDLERLALKALRDPAVADSLSPSPAARDCHRRFRHVLVDEYQDINEVQDAILALVSRESLCGVPGVETNLFSVGDVKQSIYRFRLAEPTRFLERERRFRGSEISNLKPEFSNPQSQIPDLKSNPPGEVIDLQANFRSRGPLLAAVNAVFERLMTADAADITYDASHRLHPGKTFPNPVNGECTFRGAPIELHLLPKKLDAAPEETEPAPDSNCETDDDASDLDRAEREALLVAQRIRQMMGLDGGTPTCVAETNADGTAGFRPLRFGDVVILLRSMKHKADEYAEVLEAAGVPVHSESSSGYFESMEVRDLLSLLALLDNQRQDVPLAAVLRSPLAGLERAEDALALIRIAYPPGKEGLPFHEAARRYAAERDDALAGRLRAFFAKLAEWRSLAQRRPLADLVSAVYDDTGYLAYVGGLHNGRQRVANLLYLRERAAQFGSFHRQGLSRFLQFLESLREESDLGQPSVASEAEDVVRIMSVHRSKGLEFPVVFLPDLGKAINLQDCAGSVLVDRRAGLGVAVVDEAKRVRYPSLASMLVQNRLRQQALAEELRVLYVAMTRAQEHLVLVGTTGTESPARWAARWSGHNGPLPTDAVLGARTMLDWLGPVAAATTASDVFEVRVHDPADVLAWRHPSQRGGAAGERLRRLAALEPLDPPPAPHPIADEAIRRLTARYDFGPFARTAAARPMAEGTAGRTAATLSKSPLLAGTTPPTGDEIGTATHTVLRHLDFRRPVDRESIAAQVQELVDRRLLSAAEAARVDTEAIAWLMASEVGGLLRENTTNLRRELPVYAASPVDADSTDPADRVMLRGRIDVLIPLADRSVLIDYKTDNVAAEQVPARADGYRAQVDAYAHTVEVMTGKPVDLKLVFLRPRIIFTVARATRP